MVPGIEFLGYRVDGEGPHPTDEKIAAISEAPSPKNVAELRSYLGLLNYYGHFIHNLSTLLQPLHELLQKGGKYGSGPKSVKKLSSEVNLSLSPVVYWFLTTRKGS